MFGSKSTMTSASNWWAWIVFGLACPCPLSGCGKSDRLAVTGEVVWSDQTPVESASIVFEPAAGTRAPRVAGRIVDGRFRLDNDTGPLPGSYNVKVFRDEPNDELDDPVAFAADPNAGRPVDLELTRSTSLEANVTQSNRHFEFQIPRPVGR